MEKNDTKNEVNVKKKNKTDLIVFLSISILVTLLIVFCFIPYVKITKTISNHGTKTYEYYFINYIQWASSTWDKIFIIYSLIIDAILEGFNIYYFVTRKKEHAYKKVLLSSLVISALAIFIYLTFVVLTNRGGIYEFHDF